MASSRALASKTPVPPERGGAGPAEATTPPPPSLAARLSSADVGGGTGIQEYERRRDERIRENMERMQRLGIVDLALKFRSSIPGGSSAPKRASNKRATPSPDFPPRRSSRLATSSATPSPDFPHRRSSRLQNVTPVSYSEIDVTWSEEVTEKKMGTSWEEGPIEEVYTDEHEKLLGTCETSWTLFVDGYSKDGGRIYDQVIGKTCHQCRQKTLGHRTNCSKCNLVQGQFCGDCLYMRYGENVLEANKNPNWICPVCRGICNCSICRTKKGWAPTGILYKKILRLGFKSVAHFLIQTKRAQNTEGRSAHQISAKRSLPFTDEVGPLQITNGDNNDDHYNQQMILFDDSKDKETECSGDADMQTFGECGSISTLETSKTSRKRQKKSTLIVRPSMDSIAGRLKNRRQLFRHSANNHQNDHCNGQIIALDLDNNFWLCRDEGKDSKCIGNEEVQNSDKCDDSPSLERAGTTGNKHKEEMQSTLSGKPSPNSIAGRLRYCGTGYAHDSNGEKKTQSPDEYLRSITLENSQRVDKSSKENNLDLVTVPSLDGITGKQRTHTNKDSGCKHKKSNMTLSNRKPGNKHSNGKDLAPLVQPRIDCIAGRLRSRGFNRGGNDWSVDKGTQKTVMSNNAITLDSNGKPWNRKELTLIVTPTSVSIAERLRSRNKKGEIDITLESNRKVGKKPNEGTTLALTVKSDMDCIAGRLRRRGGAYP